MELGLTPIQVSRSLEADGFDFDTASEAVDEYIELYQSLNDRTKKTWQTIGLITFLGGSFGFIYFMFFSGMGLVAFPLLAAACWGLLKFLLP